MANATPRRSKRAGFTLIELMIVCAIIGILAAIAIPKFAELIRKSQEGATKGSLGALRSALSIYYADMEGQYPADMNSLTTNGKYLSTIPTVTTPPYHIATNYALGAICGPGFTCDQSGADAAISAGIGFDE